MTTLLEQIIKASSNPQPLTSPLKYPITFNADPIIQNLRPASENPNPNPFSLIQPLDGFQISQSDSDLVDSSSKFFTQLKLKLNDPQFLSNSGSFIGILNSFLKDIAGKNSEDVGNGGSGADYTAKLLEKFGFLVGRDVMGLLIEGFVSMEQWKLLETLVVNKLVDHGFRSDFLYNMVAKKRSDLICLCLRHFSDVKASDLCRVFKYFLSPSEEACLSMKSVREEWEKEALLAIRKTKNDGSNEKTMEVAKDAAVILMMAYDGFSSAELCLHFVVSSNIIDEVVFSSAVSKLNAEEMLALIRYLGKWLRKYERFPQAVICPVAKKALGLKMCQWVPKLEDLVKCLGFVVDEHFSSLALHSEFHGELKEIEGIVSSLVVEGRLCCSVTNVIEVLKPEVGGA